MANPGPARTLDLNADLGEEVTDDAALLAVVTSANVACGYHAGHPAIMRAVRDEAARVGVSVGAQVAYADRKNFGRVARDVEADVLRDQVGLLSEIARAGGTSVRYLKPHGALYHRVAAEAGRTVLLEGFPDRAYAADGRLVPRTEPGAVDHAHAVRRALEAAGWSLHGP